MGTKAELTVGVRVCVEVWVFTLWFRQRAIAEKKAPELSKRKEMIL